MFPPPLPFPHTNLYCSFFLLSRLTLYLSGLLPETSVFGDGGSQVFTASKQTETVTAPLSSLLSLLWGQAAKECLSSLTHHYWDGKAMRPVPSVTVWGELVVKHM